MIFLAPTVMVLRLSVSVLLILAAAAAAASSTTVYKVVGSDGVVGFSDTPPEDPAAAELIAIDTPEAASSQESLQNLEAMRETTERMAADRREREAQREVARETVVLEPAAAGMRQAQPEVHYEYFYAPLPIPSRHGRPGFHPPQRPYPEREPRGIIRGPNSQLMRPILPRDRD